MRIRHGGLFGLIVLCSVVWGDEPQAAPSPGRQKAQQVCAVCHGIDGIGKNPDVPNLAGESPVYIEKQLKAFRSSERRHEQMSIIAKDLGDDDIRALAKWYSGLRIKVEVPPE
jgi:cytochrome c553